MIEVSEKHKNHINDINKRYDELLGPNATKNCKAIRLIPYKGSGDLLRNPFSIDIDKILHNTMYNRYVDKTQVFSFYKNDDITRRALHVQLVSRIAQRIGYYLELNLDLIQAIALGHDIGHTPFGHKGEDFLNEIYYKRTGKLFNHNVHSVRVLKTITNSNLTLQVYDGILCHCGESISQQYEPSKEISFEDFDDILDKCYHEKGFIKQLRPFTLEGCVVRVSDILAYIGKDRQDASKANVKKLNEYEHYISNRNFLNKTIMNIIENSIGRPYLSMDQETLEEIETYKDENYNTIYSDKSVTEIYFDAIRPMMRKIYDKLIDDCIKHNIYSPIYKHHIEHKILNKYCSVFDRNSNSYSLKISPDDVVVDYIASMTDDYFIDLYNILFGEDEYSSKIKYVSYFYDIEKDKL